MMEELVMEDALTLLSKKCLICYALVSLTVGLQRRPWQKYQAVKAKARSKKCDIPQQANFLELAVVNRTTDQFIKIFI